MMSRLKHLVLIMTAVAAAPTIAAAEKTVQTFRHTEFGIKFITEQPGRRNAASPQRRATIDVNRRTAPQSDDQEYIKLFAGSPAQEISDNFTVEPPRLAVIYEFVGLTPARQCRWKIYLDALLNFSGAPNLALTDVPNNICQQLGFGSLAGGLTKISDPNGRYLRTLVVRVEAAPSETQLSLPETVWERPTLADNAIDSDRRGTSRTLGRFARQNTNGLFIFLDESLLSGGQTLQLVVFRQDKPFWSVDLRKAPSMFGLSTVSPQLLAGTAIAIVLVIGVFFALLRRGKPLREMTVGYGSECDITLGPGGGGPLVRLKVYKGDKLKLEKLKSSTEVVIGDEPVKQKARLTSADKVLIDGKKVRFS